MGKLYRFVRAPDFIVVAIVAVVALLILIYNFNASGVLVDLDFLIAAMLAIWLSLQVYNRIGKRGGWDRVLSSFIAGIISAVVCPVVQYLVLSPFIYYPLRQVFDKTPFGDTENLLQIFFEFIFCGIIGLIIGASGLSFLTHRNRNQLN